MVVVVDYCLFGFFWYVVGVYLVVGVCGFCLLWEFVTLVSFALGWCLGVLVDLLILEACEI